MDTLGGVLDTGIKNRSIAFVPEPIRIFFAHLRLRTEGYLQGSSIGKKPYPTQAHIAMPPYTFVGRLFLLKPEGFGDKNRKGLKCCSSSC
jgi:hypothetical protein